MTGTRQSSFRTLHVAVQAVALAVMIFAIAAWMKIPFHMTIAPRESGAARMTMLSVPSTGQYDVRLVQSPVLFSLPSAPGFSGPLLGRPVDVSLPPEPPPADLYLTPTPEFPRSFFGLTGKTLEEMIEVAGADQPVPLTAGPVELGKPREQAAGYRVSWQDDPSAEIRGVDVPPADLQASAGPWQAVYFICFDAAGSPDQLLVEMPPPSSALNDLWVRTLRGWRPGEVGAGVVCRRVVVSYRPAAGPEP